MTISVGCVESTRKQICSMCGTEIPPRVQSVKITTKWSGRVTRQETRYICAECEKSTEERNRRVSNEP